VELGGIDPFQGRVDCQRVWGAVKDDLMTTYPAQFFSKASDGSRRGAVALLGLIEGWVAPRKAVDVGCGTGIWLRFLMDRGVKVLGVDGAYVNAADLEIPRDAFVAHDLEKPLPSLGEVDLVISMETAEHLSPSRAQGFVQDLCRLAPVVLFSGAIPEQGGTAHINEQWPEYWVEKFEACGFQCIDCIRPAVWHDAEVPYWYVQNAFLAVRPDVLKSNGKLRDLALKYPKPISWVHPRHFLEKVGSLRKSQDLRNWSLAHVLKCLPGMIFRFVVRRFGGGAAG